MKWMVRIFATIVMAGMLAGCGRQRWLEIRPGTYSQVQSSDGISGAAAREIDAVNVDREQETVRIRLKDGTQLAIPFATRQRSEWPTGCPTNLVEHHMEVLDLDTDALLIGEWSLRNPILVRNCPAKPEEVVFREAWTLENGGSAVCGTCLVLSRE